MGRKWANIVAKKTAKDGANSKVYAKFGVEIYVAAKKGDPDPESNSALKFVIDRAKQAQVPKHIIDKAIDKAKGNTDETFTEGRYEGFGPNGSMLIVDTLTSNVNRTAANVRAAFGKNGGNMGASTTCQQEKFWWTVSMFKTMTSLRQLMLVKRLPLLGRLGLVRQPLSIF